MAADKRQTAVLLDYTLIGVMALMLMAVGSLSVAQLSQINQQADQQTDQRNNQILAQATPPQTEPGTPSIPAGQDNGPAQSKPGGTRPTTPPPEPARPDADAQKSGAKPALPAAPAEKMGDPIKR